MHPIRIGRLVRTLRRRLGWRQIDLAARARVSQQVVSIIEIGQSRRLSLRTLERVLAELEADVDVIVRWRGGELDRILDEGHARLTGWVVRLLERHGWVVAVEVTYAFGRDRGSIDILAFHPESGCLLVVEVKTEVSSAESTLRRHDEKVRLAPQIAAERFGWRARSVSRLLVLPGASTARRRVVRHAALFDRAYPMRGAALGAWLRAPRERCAGLLFLSRTNDIGDRCDMSSRRRVRRSRCHAAERDDGARTTARAPGFIDSSG